MEQDTKKKQRTVKQSISLWLGIAIVSILCTLLFARVQDTVRQMIFYFPFGYDAASGVEYDLKSPYEVLRTAWGYSDDYFLAPDHLEERLESTAITESSASWRMDYYQELLDKLNSAEEENP